MDRNDDTEERSREKLKITGMSSAQDDELEDKPVKGRAPTASTWPAASEVAFA